MTTDNFTEAARAEAERLSPLRGYQELVVLGAEWARTHLAAQEPTDTEVLAALNAEQPWASEDSVDAWPEGAVLQMRAALSAARAARRDEEAR